MTLRLWSISGKLNKSSGCQLERASPFQSTSDPEPAPMLHSSWNANGKLFAACVGNVVNIWPTSGRFDFFWFLLFHLYFLSCGSNGIAKPRRYVILFLSCHCFQVFQLDFAQSFFRKTGYFDHIDSAVIISSVSKAEQN